MPSPNPNPSGGAFVFNDTINTAVSTVVYIKQRWHNSWVEQKEINVTDVRWSAAPGIPTATLVYRYGPATRRDGSGLLVADEKPKLNLGGYYVKIVVDCGDGDRVWIGYVDDTIDDPSGIVWFDSASVGCGKQTFSCLGMIAALSRSPITHCYFQSSGTNQGPGLTNRRVALCAPHFNPPSRITGEPGERKQIKNRAPTAVAVHDFRPSGVSYAFQTRDTFLLHCETLYSQSGATGELWTTKQIVEYLIAYHGPRDADGKERIPIWLDSTHAGQIPDWDKPELNCEGKTLKDALDDLLRSSKSLGYTTYVDETTTPHRLYIQPFTTTESAITVGANTVAANLDQLDVTTQADAATSFNVQRTESALANQIVCRGAKRILITTFKVNLTGSALADGWDTALQTAFLAEFAALGDDPASDYAKRDGLEQAKYRPMYRHYTVRPTFNWKYNNGTTDVDLFQIDQSDHTKSYTSTGVRYLPFGYAIRLLKNLPLKTGTDYTADVAAEHLSSTKPFRDMEVYGLSHPFIGTTGSGRATEWTNRSRRDVNYDQSDVDYRLNADPMPADVGLGVVLDVVGAPQTVLGASAIGLGQLSNIPDLPTGSLNVTLAIEEDRLVSQHWPDSASSSLDSVLKKVYDFGEAYQQIEMTEETILGINPDGTLKKRTSRWFVRDDRPALLDLAKQIAKWFETPRNVARLRSRRMTSKLWPGQLIKKINPTLAQEYSVNCVVTEVAIAIPIGSADSPGKPTLSITTNKGEFDPRYFIPKLRA